ncbi:SUMF1/EgtB/PvdO family nonheme iron enzyme [Candidatus Amarolinea dominans]|uniref:SUMF1/EgtB/PvdO family nonheme iron enzyme n=1 Tax=Candidatus Amarolinea dominans TaxID=3140696 RepID=UPI001DA657A6|nr:SUMF1/EgtB/PvdO family nonheme iron enzyme [Anaerolineae bacterium]
MTTSFNSAALRELLLTALSDDELTALTYHYFPPVANDFTTGQTRSQRVQLLVEYCERKMAQEPLLAQVKKINPARFAQYEQRTATLDGLLNRGLDAGLEHLSGRPDSLDQAVAELRGRELGMRQARLRNLAADAAERARAEFGGETDATGALLTDLLDQPSFLLRVAEIMLLNERPDMAQLRAEFEPRLGAERWAQSQRPLLRFLQELDRGLLADEVWGPTLREFRSEATLASIDRTMLTLHRALDQISAQMTALPGGVAQAVAQRLHPLDMADLEKSYLRGLYADCSDVPLASGSAPPDAAQNRRPRLQRIYVDLDTTTPPALDRVYTRLGIAAADRAGAEGVLRKAVRETPVAATPGRSGRGEERLTIAALRAWIGERGQDEDKRAKDLEEQLGVAPGLLRPALADLGVLEAIGQHRQLVILGDPGSGKSTLTRRLAAGLAAAARDDLPESERDWATALTGAFNHWLLPVRIVLSRWAAHLPQGDRGCADDLIAECLRLLKASGSLEGPRQKEHFLARLMAAPPTALLLLDGLDEVADAGQRRRVLDAVQHFVTHYPQVPLLVTCRQRPYHDGEHYRLPLPAVELAPLSRPAVGQFLQRWHDELTWAGLYQPAAAASAQRRLLGALDDPEREELREMAGTPLLLTMMARVNYERGLPESRAALYEEFVRKLLWEWERTKLDDQGQPTGLEILLRQAGVSTVSLERALNELAYTVHGGTDRRGAVDIPRATLRDALEGIHKGDDAARAAWAANVLKLMDDRSGLINAVEQNRLYRFSHRTFQEYLAARWLATGDFVRKFKEKIDQEQWQEAIFLALGYQVSVLGRYDDALEVIDELLPAAPNSTADWRRVLLLGEAYTRLLGPQRAREVKEAKKKKLRERVMTDVPARLTAAMHAAGLPARQRLQAGLLLDALGVEPPGLDDFVAAPGWGFAIGRYPVTNKQYRRFVTAGGYAAQNEQKWWSEQGRKDKRQYGWTEPRFWDDSRFNHDSQPVVGVSWYEANAYCAWLTEHLRGQGLISGGQAVRLPTQAEWEQAARSTDGRAYPWGPTFDAARANTRESSLQQSTPIWMYPDGQTPEGVWDMAGNVWEWTDDVDKTVGPGSWAAPGGAAPRAWGRLPATTPTRGTGTSTGVCGW